MKVLRIFFGAALLAASVEAQPNTQLAVPIADLHPNDSGWITLFNGQTLEDWTAIGPQMETNGTWKERTVPDNVFSVKNGTITTTTATPNHIIFKQNFTAYHFRMEYRFVSQLGNAGMLYHIRLDGKGCCPIDQPKFPRAIENQGQNTGAGDAWTIGQVTFQTTVVNASDAKPWTYKEGGQKTQHGSQNDANRQLKASVLNFKGGVGAWNTHETMVWGADSSYHIINGTTVLKAWNIRYDNNSTPLNYGRIGLQAEGRAMEYRNIQIKLFPQDPLYSKLYTTTKIAVDNASRFGRVTAYNSSKSSIRIEYQLPFLTGNAAEVLILDQAGRTKLLYRPKESQGAFFWTPGTEAGIYWVMLKAGNHSESHRIVSLP
jgi:hypothetical protein